MASTSVPPRPDRGATPTTGNRAFFESPALDLASDYRPVAETGSWTMTVDTTHEAAGIELSWTASTLLTSGLYLLEVNEADAPLDATNLIAMADQQSLSIEPDVVRRFQILYGAVPYFVKQVLGWQVTAHPVTIEPVDLAGLRAQGACTAASAGMAPRWFSSKIFSRAPAISTFGP